MFGLHPGFRPAHAKGMLLTGAFTPAADARCVVTRAAFYTTVDNGDGTIFQFDRRADDSR